jgi:hypothetical protein
MIASADGNGPVPNGRGDIADADAGSSQSDCSLSRALQRWRALGATHFPGKIIADLAFVVAPGCLADAVMLQGETTPDSTWRLN